MCILVLLQKVGPEKRVGLSMVAVTIIRNITLPQ